MKRISINFIFLVSIIYMIFLCDASAQPVTFQSGPDQVVLMELYTSEGCSSCPPADRWFSKLVHDDRLWSQLVPIAFHVDYWDYLGWKDRFSKSEFSMRQRTYASNRYVRTVYTPGFFQNGREWRAWFSTPTLSVSKGAKVGVLRISIQSNNITATYQPIKNITTTLLLNVAELGFNFKTAVKNGENHGKLLNHDFVVLNLQAYNSRLIEQTHHWQSTFTETKLPAENRKGLAVWVTRQNDPTPLQAAGGWIN